MDLETFFDLYISEPRPFFIPAQNSIHFVEGTLAIVIYRHEEFQVELVAAKPYHGAPEHRHPNVDSIEVYLGGSIMLMIEGEVIIPSALAYAVTPENGLSAARCMYRRIRPNEWHSGETGKHGGAFLSVQHWLNGIPPTTITDDWEGKTMGAEHQPGLYGKTA
jgi:hypothetical protein